jgi:hypothetical protein
MKSLKINFFLAFAIIALSGCLGNTGPEPTEITDPSATTHLSIGNQNDQNLTVMYKTTDAYGGLDSTVALPVDSITQILKPGGFSPPTPSEALAKLSLYKTSDDISSPSLTIEPVMDENWDDVTAEEDTVKKYELVITEEDLQ